MRRVWPDCISLSTFPMQGIYYPVCEYLCMYLCVLGVLYLPFWGEDGGVAVRSSRGGVFLQGSTTEMGIFFKGKEFCNYLFKPRFGCSETIGYWLGPPNLERCHRAGMGPGRRASVGLCVAEDTCLGDKKAEWDWTTNEEREENSALDVTPTG